VSRREISKAAVASSVVEKVSAGLDPPIRSQVSAVHRDHHVDAAAAAEMAAFDDAQPRNR